MKFVDLGTGEGIGANCHLLELGPFRILIDAGMNPREMGRASLPRIGMLGREPTAAILTHCHLDHMGALPLVTRSFPDTPILMSQPSAMLAARILHNSVNVMLRQKSETGLPELPLYTHGEVDRMGANIVALKYGVQRMMDYQGEELGITLHQSGHVAGAAAVELCWRDERILHTGDVLFDAQRHLGGAKLPEGPFSTLVMETTRGLSSRPADGGRDAETMRLLLAMEQTLLAGGSVLIPAFALGRAQEIFCILHESRRLLPQAPVYSVGLGLDIAERFDEITRKTGLLRFRSGVLKDLGVRALETDLRPGRSPARGIYVLGSGMLSENTPSYALAASLLHDPRSAVFLVGYCDPDTPGGQLMAADAGGPFAFDKLDYQTPILARVERFDLSGHADREELLAYALRSNAANILLVHGDPAAREWFRAELAEKLPNARVHIPAALEHVTA